VAKISRAVQPTRHVAQVSHALEGRVNAVGQTKRAARKPPVGSKQVVKPTNLAERGGSPLMLAALATDGQRIRMGVS
jgi:hypothetical protein